MSLFSTDSGLRFYLLQASHLAAMADLLGQAFAQHEAPAQAVGLRADEIARMVHALGAKAVDEQLTLVAFDADGTMVGAVLADDFACPPPQEAFGAAPAFATAFAPIGALLEALDDDYRAGKQIMPGQIVHLFMIGVARPANGLGLAQNLTRAAIANAKARGYRVALAEATGAASQHLLRKLGFASLRQIDYADFVFDGQTPFAGISEVPGVVLMEYRMDVPDGVPIS